MARSVADIATHEASHCAMALTLGRDVLRCAINDDGSGITEIAPPTAERTPEAERRASREMLLILVAGDLAAAVCGPGRAWWKL